MGGQFPRNVQWSKISEGHKYMLYLSEVAAQTAKKEDKTREGKGPEYKFQKLSFQVDLANTPHLKKTAPWL